MLREPVEELPHGHVHLVPAGHINLVDIYLHLVQLLLSLVAIIESQLKLVFVRLELLKKLFLNSLGLKELLLHLDRSIFNINHILRVITFHIHLSIYLLIELFDLIS